MLGIRYKRTFKAKKYEYEQLVRFSLTLCQHTVGRRVNHYDLKRWCNVPRISNWSFIYEWCFDWSWRNTTSGNFPVLPGLIGRRKAQVICGNQSVKHADATHPCFPSSTWQIAYQRTSRILAKIVKFSRHAGTNGCFYKPKCLVHMIAYLHAYIIACCPYCDASGTSIIR